MHQVAQYWNECIGITEEEKAHAKLEVDQLQEDLRQQSAKLHEANQLLDKERAERQCIDAKLKDSEGKVEKAMLENLMISQESTAIKEEFQSSKERAAMLTEKCKTYRKKLNEAILEQQRLFLQGKEFYHESIRNLRQENEMRASERKDIENSLRESYEKMDEIRRGLDKFRCDLGTDAAASMHDTQRHPYAVCYCTC
jgi:chromosome segregation ATPase